jgi:hypothetical protein
MELVKQIFAVALTVGLVAICLAVLWAIIRFSIISPRRTQGGQDRLRSPDPTGVARVTGTHLSDELVAFYRSSPVITRTEFRLVDSSQTPPRDWFIGCFVPLTALDSKEHRAISNVPGVPIATDLDGGYYYLDATNRILLRQPHTKSDLLVAQTAAQFASYEPFDMPDEVG